MKNIIVGTAGHIDHGKTALVRALTGIDTDRLEEEKRRGISIDIGFAHLDAGDVRIGFVDVPGHERFVKNMLAGAGGIDAVLFVVAADESIKPQTREHFDICRLLGIQTGIVVLTKADLVDRDILDLVRLEVEEFVAGSFLQGAPIVGVSSVTRQGLDELRTLLSDLAAKVSTKDASKHFRLPIDRSFSMRGFGTVITGTLVSGSVALEQEIEVHPAGSRLRVRGIQVHGAPAQRALAGQRTALNVSGADASELSRGMVAAESGAFESTRRIDCNLELLPSAKPLKHGAPVHFHSGTAEVEAQVRLLDGSQPLKPGSSGLIRLDLRDPLLLLPGDRFILRMFSPVVTIAGGTVLDIAPPSRMNRADSAARLRVIAGGGVKGRIAVIVRESPYGLALRDLAARTGMMVPEIEAAVAGDTFVHLRAAPQPWVIDAASFKASIDRLRKALEAYHRENPLLPGMPREELRSRELPDAPAFVFDALLSGTKGIVSESEVVRLATHSLALKRDEEAAVGKIENAFAAAGLAVPSTPEVLAKCGVEPGRARSLLQILLREKKLVRVTEDLVFHQSAIQQLRNMLATRKGEQFNVASFKDWTGISRKYAIPLLEYLDRERVTRRVGDARIIL